ncbi:MAG: 30S ribosome-binding factor RbfA [bacterium]|nr:30S ribosome-binding factor RbfA [bacterium]
MSQARAGRVGEAIKEVVSETVRRLKDSRITALVSVTDVEVSRDLRHAKVFVSLYGEQEDVTQTLEGLQSAIKFIRGEVARTLQLRTAPTLQIVQDPSLSHGAHIHALLSQLKQEREEPESPAAGEDA